MKTDQEPDRARRMIVGQQRRVVRPPFRDGDMAVVTNGGPVGTDGEPIGLRARLRRADRRDLGLGWGVVAAITVAVMVVNALTELNDNPSVRPWEPWVWESSSALMVVVLLWLPWLTTNAAPPTDAWNRGLRLAIRFGVLHLAGAGLYSLLHVTGFVGLRGWAYDLMGARPYEFGSVASGFLYELRKDLLSYAAFVAVFWICGRLRKRAEGPLRPVSFDIRDGARVIRAPVEDILAVSSAGNYVEVWLADGRRPLMRATLAAIEGELAPFGFVRAHRSWLVNTRRVTGLAPDGSGDWTVELGRVSAPVSRRYPEALDRLKTPL
ncbi:LytTR family DNA-binding domain-containing protein [Brevundimonas aurifodinae]|uniref:LytTR family DNA-binding domain-containing protein n=1 Tax=Brevundimonas aurifodinae TaxID=1508312 RepID=A0ABV1NL11_9CAUL